MWSGQDADAASPPVPGMSCEKSLIVFGISKLPPWVERCGGLRRLNREIINNFPLRTEEDVINKKTSNSERPRARGRDRSSFCPMCSRVSLMSVQSSTFT